MKTSPNGGRIRTGHGVAAVRKKIEDAFASVRTKVEGAGQIQREAASVRPLSHKAEPILLAAVQRHKDAPTPIHHNAVHCSAVHVISVPRKSAEQLSEEALKLLGGKRG